MDIRCQQFTPHNIANEMLDLLEYKDNLYGKKLLENSCGEGNILCLAVERYIKDAIANGYTSEEIVLGLEEDIYAAEIVKTTHEKCIDNLNMLAEAYGLKAVKWNVYLGDVLIYPFDMKFDYIIGNPPYISYRNLEKESRQYIKDNYETCKQGKPDYCYAFIENAIKYLAAEGKMVYLIPNSIYKNVYAKALRNMILHYVEEIRDYPNCKLFDNAMTSSSIMLLKKNCIKTNIQYSNIPANEEFSITKKALTGKWIFRTTEDRQNTVRFGDLFKASMTIATQRNNIFVINGETKKTYGIEQGALRPAISPRNQKYKNKEYILFPYKIRNHKVINYSELEFLEKYPNAHSYLNENKAELEKRDADKSAEWFEFGRSQAIQNMNKEKLLVSTVVTNRVWVYNVSARAVPYAGIYIISDCGYDLELARQILESEQFLQYIKGIGTPASGNSLRITANDINNFCFVIDEL